MHCLFIRRHPLLHVSVQYLRPMRDAWFFFRYHLAATADHSDAIPPPLSQLTGSFAILPLPRRSETIQAIVPIPDALVSRTCVTGNLSRGVASFLSLEMRYLFVSHVVNFILRVWFPKGYQCEVLYELGYSVKIHH